MLLLLLLPLLGLLSLVLPSAATAAAAVAAVTCCAVKLSPVVALLLPQHSKCHSARATHIHSVKCGATRRCLRLHLLTQTTDGAAHGHRGSGAAGRTDTHTTGSAGAQAQTQRRGGTQKTNVRLRTKVVVATGALSSQASCGSAVGPARARTTSQVVL